jgi:hypothetical protein
MYGKEWHRETSLQSNTMNWQTDNLNIEQPIALETLLPGPDRKRTAAAYQYRLIYQNPDPEAVGCKLIWEVSGGRAPYQIAIERTETGEVHSHCTCADAIFRAFEANHVCKHIQGLLQIGRELLNQPQEYQEPAVRACA